MAFIRLGANFARSKLFLLQSQSQNCLQIQKRLVKTVQQDSLRPLVVLLPWLGATHRATEKYVELYKKLDFDVISYQPVPIDILWPLAGMKKSRNFLLNIQKEMKVSNRPVIVHCISVGGYFFALMLLCLEKEQKLFQNILSNIRCQVIDSPVIGTMNEVAIGVSLLSANSKPSQTITQFIINAYFKLLSPFTVTHYNKSMDAIKFRPSVVPALMMTSNNDPMMLPRAFDGYVDAWSKRGIEVKVKMWQNSEHAQHFKHHPDEYTSLVQNFVKQFVT